MDNIPFSALVMVHRHMTNLMSSNDDKFDFVDSNRIPYAVKFNPEIANFFAVADENGFIKFFTSYPKLQPIKEFSAQKSCIYDLQWLNSHEIACGGGDQNVSIFDVNTGTKLALLKGHTESVKSIAQLSINPFVLASGSRDGSVLIFDVRFNRSTDPSDSNLSHIRAVNHINKAHFVEDSTNHGSGHKLGRLNAFNASSRMGNVLKTKHSNINNSFNSQPSLKKASPVASVLFQNEHTIVSAGATDGLIKVWDTRKIYMSSSVKKNVDPSPLYIFDNQIRQDHTSHLLNLNSKTSKGYSNIIMNHSRSRLYANCMNNYIYEYNYQTYNDHHTRMLNKSNLIKESTSAHKNDDGTAKKKYHTNQSNYIKSSISQCDKFILTGSSDFNAYIYSTNENSDCQEFRKHMPVIVLKGHNNEVTAVDWNPQNPDQLITCSDDNTIRVWNVKREIDMLKSNECNYCTAEIINEFEENKMQSSDTENPMDENVQRSLQTATSSNASEHADIDNIHYISRLKCQNRKITKHLPHTTGIFDDFIFTRYELNHFIRIKNKRSDEVKNINFANSLENELCMKWNNINIETYENTQTSSYSSSSSSQNSFSSQNIHGINTNTSFEIIDLPTLTSNLPINILDTTRKSIDEITTDKPNTSQKDSGIDFFNSKFSHNLLSMSSLGTKDQKKTTKRTQKPRIRHQPSLQSDTSEKKLTNLTLTPSQPIEKLCISTSKKRQAVESTNSLFEQSARSSKEPRTPISKRRLDMNELSPKSNALKSQGELLGSPIRTIRDYFSPKPPQNKN